MPTAKYYSIKKICNTLCIKIFCICRCLYILHDLVVFGLAYRGLTGGSFYSRFFSVAISVSPRVCFISVLIFDFYVSRIMHL